MNRLTVFPLIAAAAAVAMLLSVSSAIAAEASYRAKPLAFYARPVQAATPTAAAPAAASTITAPIGLISPTVPITSESAGSGISAASSLEAGTPLSGTIIANRSDYAAKYFVEGEMSELEPMRSVGLQLPRTTAVLNLFTCGASTADSKGGCYWDPYLLQRDGFYEVYDSSGVDGLPKLMLREAGAAPSDQVWVQNRTGKPELIVYQDTQIEIAAGAVEQFEISPGAPTIVYVRSCLTLDKETVCEWSPLTLDSGGYFAMVEVSTRGAQSGSLIATVNLSPIVDASGEAVAQPIEATCQAQVPAINVRSGPGLQYEIIGKIRESDSAPGRVIVIGRSADKQWYAVADSVAPGGWVTASPSFILCTGDVEQLPITEFTAPSETQREALVTPSPLAPAPTSAPVAQVAPVEVTDVAAATPEPEQPTAEPTAEELAAPAIPEGLAMLVVNNGFQYDIRFTIDQSYRPTEGPSEYDLRPGESTTLLIYPGRIAFTASSPWNGLSGNSELEIGSDQSVVLWLRFEPDQGNSGKWNLAWQ